MLELCAPLSTLLHLRHRCLVKFRAALTSPLQMQYAVVTKGLGTHVQEKFVTDEGYSIVTIVSSSEAQAISHSWHSRIPSLERPL